MENMLRNLVLFIWSILFGFFSWTAYLDDTMASSNKLIIVVGLLLILVAYIAMEWYTRKANSPSPLEKIQAPTPTDERILRRLHTSGQDGGSIEPATHLPQRSSTVPSAKHYSHAMKHRP